MKCAGSHISCMKEIDSDLKKTVDELKKAKHQMLANYNEVQIRDGNTGYWSCAKTDARDGDDIDDAIIMEVVKAEKVLEEDAWKKVTKAIESMRDGVDDDEKQAHFVSHPLHALVQNAKKIAPFAGMLTLGVLALTLSC